MSYTDVASIDPEYAKSLQVLSELIFLPPAFELPMYFYIGVFYILVLLTATDTDRLSCNLIG